jgi:hypothetical protein
VGASASSTSRNITSLVVPGVNSIRKKRCY